MRRMVRVTLKCSEKCLLWLLPRSKVYSVHWDNEEDFITVHDSSKYNRARGFVLSHLSDKTLLKNSWG